MNPTKRSRLVRDLEATPARVAALLARVPACDVAARPQPDASSAREQAHHLRDIDAEGFALRLRRMLEESEPFLPDVDGARLALERRYNATPHETALAAFVATRAECVARLERLADAEWSRRGVLEGVGSITVEQLVERWLEHDRAHLAELEALAGGAAGAADAETAWGHELALR